ncbi:tetratricopeptide repeat protein [Labrys portucalensis]|uniref:Tetratricopeptide repeat protein n=1 Tax=Labrys neptuniae TaxID=376174 RepID=A0ABV6Z9G8_9HYPH
MSMKLLAGSLIATALALSWSAPGLADPARPLRLAQASQSAEDIFWQSVQNSTDPAMFQAYLDQVANGTFKGIYKPLAEIKLKALGKAAAPSTPAPETTAQDRATPPPATEPTTSSPPAQTAQDGALSPDIEACDRAAAHAMDEQKPANLPGVTFDKLDTSAAITACLRATQLADAPAREFFQLGRSYDKAGNYKEAMVAYKAAMEKGHKRAIYNVATGLMKNQRGVKKDPAAALALMERAADEKVMFALSGLGDYYRLGVGGRRNYPKAIDYYNQAIAAGDSQGYVGLAIMTYDGTGMPRNRNKACDLWQKGSSLGDVNAADYSKRYCRYR